MYTIIVVIEITAVRGRWNVEDVFPGVVEDSTLGVSRGGIVSVAVEQDISDKVACAEESGGVSISGALRRVKGEDLLDEFFIGGVLSPNQRFEFGIGGLVCDREGSDSGFPAGGGSDDLSDFRVEFVGFEAVRKRIGEDVAIGDGEEALVGTVFTSFGGFGEGPGGPLENG